MQCEIRTVTYKPDGEVVLGEYHIPLPRMPHVGDYINLNSYGVALGTLRIHALELDINEILEPILYMGFDTDNGDDEELLQQPEAREVKLPGLAKSTSLVTTFFHRDIEAPVSPEYTLTNVPPVGAALYIKDFADLAPEELTADPLCVVQDREWELSDQGQHTCTIYVGWDGAEEEA